MVSVVQKLLKPCLLIIAALCLNGSNDQIISNYLIGADLKDQEIKKDQNPVIIDQPSISLERRLDRSPQIIEFKRNIPTEPLKPVLLRLDRETRALGKTQSPALSLNGLIQRITMNKDSYEQGEIASLDITAVLPLTKPKINFLYHDYNLYEISPNLYNTVLAVPMNTEPGKYEMTLRYQEEGEEKDLKMPFTVIPGRFSEDDTAELDISILTEETLEMLKYEGNYFARAYGRNPDKVMYEGDFIWPCSGGISALYGTPRKYNKDMDEWSHKAIDIANAVGTKVYAPNNGLVVMARNLEVHGKSIVIAHGKKIHTIYLHLDSLCVKKGDEVKKGQLIGKLGKTGLCTGPNLHWGFVVNRVHVNPRFWLEGEPEVKKGQWIDYTKPAD
jgi:murein DD-endopeptidase MepM/ murein hydrolase activator NlpD